MVEDKTVLELNSDIGSLETSYRVIDLVSIVKVLWNGRKIIQLSALFFLFLGITIAFVSPDKYSASAVILPSADSKSGALSGLGALAGMAGINVTSMLGQGNNFDPALYPEIAESTPFLLELMKKNIYWKEYKESLSLYDYLERQDNEVSLSKTVKKYTIQLPSTIKSLFAPAPLVKNLSTENSNGYYELSERQINTMVYLSSLISVNYEKSTGLIKVGVSLGEPLAVAQLAQNAVELFQKYIIQYKIKKVSDNLMFLEKRGDEKRIEYQESQNKLMTYKDTHRNMVQERTDFEFQKLSDSYDIIVSVYKGLMQNIEQSRIAVKEETPVFSVIMPVVVPIKKDSPKRAMIVAGMLAFGLFFGICFVYFLVFFFDLIDRERIELDKTRRFSNKMRYLCGIK